MESPHDLSKKTPSTGEEHPTETAQSQVRKTAVRSTTSRLRSAARIVTRAGIVALGLVSIPIILGFASKAYLDRAQQPVETLMTAGDGSPDSATSLAWSPGPDSRLLVGTQSGNVFRISADGTVETKVTVSKNAPVMQILPGRNLEHYDLTLEQSAFTDPDRGGRLLTLYETSGENSQRLQFSAFSRGLVAALHNTQGATLYNVARLSFRAVPVAGSVTQLVKRGRGDDQFTLVRTDPALDITRLASFGKPSDPNSERLVVGDASGNVATIDEDRSSGANNVIFVGRHGDPVDQKAQFAPEQTNRIIALSATTLAELDNAMIASAAADGSIKVWSPLGGSSAGHAEAKLAAFAPSQNWSGSPANSWTFDGKSRALSISGDLSQHAFGSEGGRVAISTTDTNAEMWVSDVTVSNDTLVRFSKDDVMIMGGGEVYLYARTGEPKVSFRYPGYTIRAAAFDNSGQRAAIAVNDVEIRIFDTTTGKSVKTWPREDASIMSLAFDPTDKLLAAGLTNGRVEVRNVDDNTSFSSVDDNTLFSLNVVPDVEISQVGFSASGRRLLTIDQNGVFRSFSMRSLQQLISMRGSPYSRTVLSNNGAFVAFTAGTSEATPQIRIADSDADPFISGVNAGFGGTGTLAQVSDDGNAIALLGEPTANQSEANLQIWRKTIGPETETALPPVASNGLTLSSLGSPLLVREPSGALHITTWSSDIPYRLRPVPLTVPTVQATLNRDGSEIVAACIDGLIRIIPAESTDPAETLEISGHGDMVNRIALSPDDAYLASASIDGKVRITDLGWARWLNRLPLSWLPANPPLTPMTPQRLADRRQAIPANEVQQTPATAN